ncbi:YlbL family protein [Streptomyces zagrosensis]|uniref:endopeptidase La n=1 Tax=Streptomyces zagrosensis TaxID=1042984 RepID=A0A7W9QAT8_9ACTN|nr:S16 family serine protease [Streptomyces zagrosensis]MBB5936833.1 PDZ domain-containing protein [Streptomyces zagrosensis]
MPRRTATLLASLLTLIALLCAGALIPVPYSEMSPGPTVNTLGKHKGETVLQITGHKTYPTSGHLNMTTVRVTNSEYKMNLVEAVYGWLTHDNAVVPHKTLYPDDKSADEVNQENAEEFSQSQESAKVAALKQLKKMKELDIKVGSHIVVGSVFKGGPAEGTLHAGDAIKAVDGKAVHSPSDVAKLVTEHKAGEKTVFTVIPAERVQAAEKAHKEPKGAKNITITTVKAPQEERAIVGIEAAVDYTFPFDINITVNHIGGPSAGLMFSLGIIDKLTPGDLTGGEFVAGTGTIEETGKVGPIGGISMKTVGARAKGAKFFLTPEANCATATRDIPDGLTLVKVSDLDDAVTALKNIREKKTDKLPSCPKS